LLLIFFKFKKKLILKIITAMNIMTMIIYIYFLHMVIDVCCVTVGQYYAPQRTGPSYLQISHMGPYSTCYLDSPAQLRIGLSMLIIFIYMFSESLHCPIKLMLFTPSDLYICMRTGGRLGRPRLLSPIRMHVVQSFQPKRHAALHIKDEHEVLLL
jgi:hypothetical protein